MKADFKGNVLWMITVNYKLKICPYRLIEEQLYFACYPGLHDKKAQTGFPDSAEKPDLHGDSKVGTWMPTLSSSRDLQALDCLPFLISVQKYLSERGKRLYFVCAVTISIL